LAISSSTRKAGPFLGNDATTVFPFAFKVFTTADLRVVRTNALGVESDLVLDTDYTVALNANQDNDPGGTVTRATALPTGERLTITSDVEALQPLVLTNNGGFYPRVINDAFDKITIIAQQLIEQVGRSLKLPISSTASATLPDPVANRLIAWNSSANGFTNVDPASLATVAAYADANLELFTGNGTQTDFVLAQDPAVLANLDVSISGVTQVGGEDFTWIGTTLTFVVAPPNGTRIQVRYTRAIPPADLASAVAAAEADRVATAADRVQTGLDRVATAADAVATAADVVAAEADRVATAADRVQTGLDRVQTGLDRVQTGADVASAAAVLASAALKANNLSDLASASAARTNIGVPAYGTRALVEAATIIAEVKSLQTLGYTTAGVGGATYARTSLVTITAGSYPAASYFRSLDRIMPDGSTDNTNGGYWLLSEKTVRPEMFGAVGDGSTNDTVAVQAAFTYGPAEIIADRTYKVNSAVTGSRSVNLSGQGTFDCSAGGSITISGTVTQVSDLSANVLIGATTLSFTTVTGIAAFDDLFIYNPTDYSFSNANDNYRAGEAVSVATISGTTVTIAGQTVAAYTAADVDVYRLNPVTVRVSDLKFIESTSGSKAALSIVFGADCELHNVRVRSSDYGGVVLDRCLRSMIVGGNAKNNSVAHGLDYGVVIANCQDFTVTGGAHSATRHAFTLGGSSEICCIPCRNGKIIGLTLRSSVSNASADLHGNCEFIEYINCNIYDSAAIGGQNVALRGCNVFARASADGCCVVLSEVNGGQILIDGCTFYTNGNGNAFGYIHFIAATLPKSKTTLVVRNLVVRGLTSEASGGGASARVVCIVQTATSSTQKIDVDVQGVRCAFPELSAFVDCTNNSTGTFYSDGIIADNLFGPAFTYIIRNRADIAAVPTREMTQRGRAFKTTTASPTLTATAQTYKLRYSRQPKASAPGLSTDPSGATLTLGGKTAIPLVYEVTATTVTPAMASSDGGNFTAGVYVSMDWEVGIKDI
jgi:hypothetical protein